MKCTLEKRGVCVEINVKEARSRFSELIDKVENGNEIVINRRGKKVARLVPLEIEKKLPSLKEFRASIKLKGKILSEVVSDDRKEGRY
jgi:prevent-host-death family protein